MLQPIRRAQLDSNIRELLKNGGSNEDIERLAADFTAKFGNESEDLKKKDSSISTTQKKELVLEPTTGSSGGQNIEMKTFTGLSGADLKTLESAGKPVPKINEKLKGYIDVNVKNIKRQKTLEKELSSVSVTPENQEEVSAKTDELVKLQKQQEDLKEAAKKRELEKQNYSKIGSLTNKLATGSSQIGADFAAIPELAYDIFAIPQNAIADVFNLPSFRTDSEEFKKTVGVNNAVKDFYKQEVVKLREEAQKTDLKYQDGIYDSFVQGDYSGGFDQLTNSFAESLPVTTSIMVGGAATKAPQLIAASSMMFGAGKNEKLKDENSEMNNNIRVANALATGLIQGATESLGTGSIGAAARGLVQREGAGKAVNILKDGLAEYYKNALRKNPLLASMSGEGLEEAFQGVAENAVDVATGVKPSDYNVYQNMADDFIGGAFGGAIFGAGLKGLKQVTNYQDKNKIQTNTKKVFSLQNELQNPDLSPESKQEITKNIDGLITINRKLVQKNVEHVEDLPEKIREVLLKSIDITESTQEKAKQIKLDPSTSNETKQILLDNLQKEYKIANDKKNKILEGSVTEVDVLPLKEQDKLKREALKELSKELNPDGKKNITITNDQITKRANDILEKQKIEDVKPVEKPEIEETPELDIKVEKGGVFTGEFLNDYDLLAEGSEHIVYKSKDGKTVIKIGEPHSSSETFDQRVSDAKEIDRLIGDGSLTVIGKYKSPNGAINPVYQQKFIEGKPATNEQVSKHLTSKGFVQVDENTFVTNDNGVIKEISDISDNFIINDKGDVTAIDAAIREIPLNNLSPEIQQKLIEIQQETIATEIEPQAEVQKPTDETQEVEEVVTPEKKPAIINERTEGENIAADGGVRPGTKSVDEVRVAEQEDTIKEPVSETTKPEPSEGEVEVKKQKEVDPEKIKREEFRDKIKELPHSGEFSKYASGETIEKVEGEVPRNEQEIEISLLKDVGQHGKETIEKAKEIFGDKYVEKTLEYLDEANLKPHEKAVLYVSLENEMYDRLKENSENLSDKKLQDLVREKSQAHLRESSLGINAGRLRAFMKEGYIPESLTNKMFSEKQLSDKKKLEKSIQANADEINKEAESRETYLDDSNLEKLISEGVNKQINDIYQKLPTQRKQRADKAIKALENIQKKLRGSAYDATIGVPIAIIDSGITVIKNAIKAGVAVVDAIELGINHIKSKHDKKWDKESNFREDMINGFNELGVSLKEKVQSNKYKNEVKDALIDSGFGREINVTVNEKDESGNIVLNEEGKPNKVKEKRTILDWKKLAGPQGSVDVIRENVEKSLKKKGYSKDEIKKISKEYEKEYNDLRSSIIEKSINELVRRNAPKKKIDIKSTSKRLAELYNYGLFEKETDTYNNLINSALGLNDLDQKAFTYLESLAKSLADLYATGYSETALSPAISNVNKKIARTLASVAFSQSNSAFKAANVVSEYINLSQRFLLVTLGQLIDNPVSGKIQRIMSKLGYALDKTDNKALENQRKKISKERFKSIVRDAGDAYGDSSSLLINESKVENWLNNKTDSKIQHSIISFYMGRAFLEGFDSRHKTVLTEKYFVHNLIKVLSDKSNPNAMSKEKALEFVTEKLTGESFEEAKSKAKEITDKINEDAGKKILSDNDRAINIFAQEIMKDSLLSGENLSKEEIEASYKSAYKSAGKDIGHVANNPISESVGSLSASTSRRLDKAIKDKNWNLAALYTMEQVLTRNIMNTFVGGGTNWMVLGAQKSGLLGLPFIAIDALKKSGQKIDLTTEEGMKNLENVLEKTMTFKNTANRVFIGSMSALIVCALAISSGADDDLNSWLKKNKWAKKWFDKLAPSYLVGLLAYENNELGRYFEKLLGVKPEIFNDTKNLAKSFGELADPENENKGGSLGKVIGNKLNAPAPVKMAQDIRDIYRVIAKKPPVDKKFKASNFWNGYFQGGLIDFLGYRPGPDAVEKSKSKNIGPNPPSPPKPPSPN